MQEDNENFKKATLRRIELLAKVGDALFEINNELKGETVYFLAHSALEEFKEEISKLELSSEVLAGIQKLINYLETKLKKRIAQHQNT